VDPREAEERADDQAGTDAWDRAGARARVDLSVSLGPDKCDAPWMIVGELGALTGLGFAV
jgi:hypothetical protein